jgi:hypothetical protein
MGRVETFDEGLGLKSGRVFFRLVLRAGSIFDFSFFDSLHQFGIKVLRIMGKMVFHSPAYGHQFSIGMTDDSGDLSIVLGEGLVQAIPDFDFHG